MVTSGSTPIRFNRRPQTITDSIEGPFTNILLLLSVNSMSVILKYILNCITVNCQNRVFMKTLPFFFCLLTSFGKKPYRNIGLFDNNLILILSDMRSNMLLSTVFFLIGGETVCNYRTEMCSLPLQTRYIPLKLSLQSICVCVSTCTGIFSLYLVELTHETYWKISQDSLVK